MSKHSTWAAIAFTLSAQSVAAHGIAAQSVAAQSVAAQQIPLVQGLTVVKAIRDDRGDYEALVRVRELRPDAIELSISSDLPDAKNPGQSTQFHVTRVVRRADLASSHRLNALYTTADPPLFPGSTAIQTSAAVLEELKTKGSTEFVFGMELPSGGADKLFGGLLNARRYFRGTLKRVSGATAFPVLVNGVRRQLPVVRAAGRVMVGGEGGEAEFVFLDDPANPLNLRWSFVGWAVQIVSIEWDAAAGKADAAGGGRTIADGAAELGAKCRTEVHGVHFDFGSPVIKPESEPALTAIAAILKGQPSWSVTIEGHTDSVGAPKANLDLSRRRADAVREALQTRFGIAATRLSAAGFGASKPVESNTTLEGRARNRRVELARKC